MDVVNSSIISPSGTATATKVMVEAGIYTVVPNGIDDTKSIQAAMDAAASAGGGKVVLAPGTFKISATLILPEFVGLSGAGMRITSLLWMAKEGGVMLDTTNLSTKGKVIEGIGFLQDTSVTGEVTGILGGAAMSKYNSHFAAYRDLYITGLKYGIRGNADPSGVGIFDTSYDNLYIEKCYIGVWIDGSQSAFYNPKIVNCEYGLYLDTTNAETSASIQLFGGCFISNGWDYYISPTATSLRPSIITGAWHEGSKNGIIGIPATTKIKSFKFLNCLFQSNQLDPQPLLDFSKVTYSSVVIDNCTISVSPGQATTIVKPTSSTASCSIKNVCRYIGGNVVEIDDKTSTSVTIPSVTGAWTAQTLDLTKYNFSKPPVPVATVQSGTDIAVNVTGCTATQLSYSVKTRDGTTVTSVKVHWHLDAK